MTQTHNLPFTGFIATNLDWADGNGMSAPPSGTTNNYTTTGSFTVTLTVANTYSGSITTICTDEVTVSSAAIDGTCGPASGAVYYGQNSLTS